MRRRFYRQPRRRFLEKNINWKKVIDKYTYKDFVDAYKEVFCDYFDFEDENGDYVSLSNDFNYPPDLLPRSVTKFIEDDINTFLTLISDQFPEFFDTLVNSHDYKFILRTMANLYLEQHAMDSAFDNDRVYPRGLSKAIDKIGNKFTNYSEVIYPEVIYDEDGDYEGIDWDN